MAICVPPRRHVQHRRRPGSSQTASNLLVWQASAPRTTPRLRSGITAPPPGPQYCDDPRSALGQSEGYFPSKQRASHQRWYERRQELKSTHWLPPSASQYRFVLHLDPGAQVQKYFELGPIETVRCLALEPETIFHMPQLHSQSARFSSQFLVHQAGLRPKLTYSVRLPNRRGSSRRSTLIKRS